MMGIASRWSLFLLHRKGKYVGLPPIRKADYTEGIFPLFEFGGRFNRWGEKGSFLNGPMYSVLPGSHGSCSNLAKNACMIFEF